MGEVGKKDFRRHNKAMSSTMATVIITAITIAIVISLSLWIGGFVGVFSRFEKVVIKKAYVTNSGGDYIVNIEYVNTGSSSASIDSILLNGVPYSSYIPHTTLNKNFSTLPSICEVGVSKSGEIIIPSAASDPSGNRLTDGVTLVITLHTIGGIDYTASVTLLGAGNIDPKIVFVTVDSENVTTLNKLSLGFMIDYEWKIWRDSATLREFAHNANFKLVRLFDFKYGSPQPCSYWDESTKTGTWNWEDVDLLVYRILGTGAEPMFCFGASDESGPQIVPGMAVNPDTDLPYPESFAAYATEWVRHFKALGLPVRFYEIWNEPWTYFSWDPDFAKLANFMQLFNAAAASMRSENPNLSISHNFIMRKPVLDYWLANGGADVDYLDFHDYGSNVIGQWNDIQMLARAESNYFGAMPLGYSIDEARNVWLQARGKLLPVINSEGNFNSAWANGTDRKIQQMVGTVWTALVLRMDILEGVSYNVYYSFCSSLSYERTKQTSGAGFGMIDIDNDQPWYPYYVHYMLGRNLAAGDQIVSSTSSSDDIRSLAWVHEGNLKILLICKVDQPRIIYLQGLQGQLRVSKIDDTVSWEEPSIHISQINSTDALTLNGYTVTIIEVIP